MTAVDLRPEEIDLAKRMASLVARRWRSVEVDEVQGHLWAWLCEPRTQYWVVRYRTDPHGVAKLTVAMKRRGAEFAAKEQQARTGSVKHDHHTYTLRQLRAILPVAYDLHSWPQADSRSFEPGLALTMVADVASVLPSLGRADQMLLREHFHAGRTIADLASRQALTYDAMRKRIDAVLGRLRARLGTQSLAWTGESGNRNGPRA